MPVRAQRHREEPAQVPRVPDAPIDYSVPYKARVKGAARHFGFLPFFAKKPWPVVQEYIRHYSSPGELVCDPFSGSGVTPVESLVLGRRAVATDINPIARFLTRMTAIAPVDVDRLRQAFGVVQAVAAPRIAELMDAPDADVVAELTRLDFPTDPIPPTVRRGGLSTVDQLHTPRQLATLAVLRSAIEAVEEVLDRDLLLVAFANTVRYANRMYILPHDAHGRPRSPYRGDVGFLRRFSYSLASQARFHELPVWATFERTFKGVIEAKQETNALIGNRYNASNFQLADLPAARVHEVTGEGCVDYCFADPPYANDIFFLDLSTLWAAWLRFPITPDARRAELIERGSEGKTRAQFAREFGESVESIARALRPGRWLTLVYKHRDLTLWQTIVRACEDAGLRYVNAVWQDLNIRSTRQVEQPNINPKGDMYLNFRRMDRRVFERTYPRAVVLDLPTLPNYVEKEAERLIVSYLGADIELLVSGIIRRLLDTRAFRVDGEDPQILTNDIQRVLESDHFKFWRMPNSNGQWLIAEQRPLDVRLPAFDRARYATFDFMRQRGTASEGDVSQHLLSCWAADPEGAIPGLDVPGLLRHVAVDLGDRRWRFDPELVVHFKQLRLIFDRSRADELLDAASARRDATPLRPNFEAMALLLSRLKAANVENSRYEEQRRLLLNALGRVFQRTVEQFPQLVETIVAAGPWADFGIDLRDALSEELRLDIVLRSDERPFSLHLEFADRVFGDVEDEQMLLHFRLLTKQEWQHAVSLISEAGEQPIALFDRA